MSLQQLLLGDELYDKCKTNPEGIPENDLIERYEYLISENQINGHECDWRKFKHLCQVKEVTLPEFMCKSPVSWDLQTLIKELGHTSPKYLYRFVRSWDDFVMIQKAWLMNQMAASITSSDYFDSSAVNETYSQHANSTRDDLLILHDYGIISSHGQDSFCGMQTWYKQTIPSNVQQKSEIDFVAPHELGKKLINILRHHPNMYVKIAYISRYTPRIIYDNIPYVDEIYLITRYLPQDQDEWIDGTWMNQENMIYIGDYIEEFEQIGELLEGCFAFSLVSEEWCQRPTVTQNLIEILSHL